MLPQSHFGPRDNMRVTQAEGESCIGRPSQWRRDRDREERKRGGKREGRGTGSDREERQGTEQRQIHQTGTLLRLISDHHGERGVRIVREERI